MEQGYTYAAQVRAGAHANGPRGSLSTYSDLEEFFVKHGGELLDGAWIVDGRKMDDDAAFRTAIHGPMIDQRAGVDDTWSGKRYRPPSDPVGALVASVVAGNAGIGHLVLEQAEDRDEPGPLDRVPPADMARIWREAGARIGRWIGGQVVWQD